MMEQVFRSLLLAVVLTSSTCNAALGSDLRPSVQEAGDDWSYYNGNAAGTHYSALNDINTKNVSRLGVAWTYDTKDPLGPSSTIESNPLIIGGRLYFISANGRLICLDAASGREQWIFDPGAGLPEGQRSWRRGVAYWSDGNDQRILFTFRDDLYSVDARTGRSDTAFGVSGKVALDAHVSSPGVVFKDAIILGGAVSSIRAFNVRTGKLLWTFHTIPRPGEFGYETWPTNAWKTAFGVNNWSGMSLDVERGIVFVPLAFPQTFYGGDRHGDNLFANSLVALDALTGRRIWHFQTIRHDVRDWDLPAPPTLVRVRRNGKLIDAVAQVSKVGFVYVLDRVTGESLFPLVERPALQSDIPGELMPKTQIEPLVPAPFARQGLSVDMLTTRTPQANAAAAAQFRSLRSRGLWDPPSEQGTIVFPGIEGGAEWGGAAYEPNSGWLFVNSNELASILTLRKVAMADDRSGGGIYRRNCASCHGESRRGYPPEVPSLLGISERLTFNQIARKIAEGGGRMPAFQALATDYTKAWPLIEYLKTGVEDGSPGALNAAGGSGQNTYVLDGMPKFVDVDGYPATTPPWGTLSAIDLHTGTYMWKIPLGEYPELVDKGGRNTGSENYGGAIVTAGGVLFIAATSFDKKFRAYEALTGRLLWEATLPAAGNATPSTYRVNGRQFVVIAAGGGRPIRAESGSKVVAFALRNE